MTSPLSFSNIWCATGRPTPSTPRLNSLWWALASGRLHAPPRRAQQPKRSLPAVQTSGSTASAATRSARPATVRAVRTRPGGALTSSTRRLGRSGRNADTYLPVLTQPQGVSPAQLRACLDELEVRGELTPAAFTIDDARDLCVRLSQVYADGVTEQVARRELRPIYRELFELLARTSSDDQTPLADSPLAARTSTGITFLRAQDILYASVSGSRERSGVQDRVPLFVLEAEPGANRPLRELFGAPLLENALEWRVQPGEPVLDDTQMASLPTRTERTPPATPRTPQRRSRRPKPPRQEGAHRVRPTDRTGRIALDELCVPRRRPREHPPAGLPRTPHRRR